MISLHRERSQTMYCRLYIVFVQSRQSSLSIHRSLYICFLSHSFSLLSALYQHRISSQSHNTHNARGLRQTQALCFPGGIPSAPAVSCLGPSCRQSFHDGFGWYWNDSSDGYSTFNAILCGRSTSPSCSECSCRGTEPDAQTRQEGMAKGLFALEKGKCSS